MAEKKPSVIPTQDEIKKAHEELGEKPELSMIEMANQTGTEIAEQFKKEREMNVIGEVPMAEQAAAEAMRLKTESQIRERERLLKIQQDRAKVLDDERAKMSTQRPTPPTPPAPPAPPVTPPTDNYQDDNSDNNPEIVDRYYDISQPQMNTSFDVIPLPSGGKLYKNGKKSIKVAYLTAADENILTNPNLMESGEFLEILLNRKILEPELRYKDLHVGDRNAIMIWLRATGYGHEYPITVYDPETAEPFEHIVDLTELKTIKLDVETDKDGYIDYVLPLSKTNVKLKLLTVGDVSDIEEHVSKRMELNDGSIDTVTYTLEKQIVEVNGNRDKNFIKKFIQGMRVGDSNGVRNYIDKIDSGIDMKLSVGTTGGGSLETFLPINFKFFWPNL